MRNASGVAFQPESSAIGLPKPSIRLSSPDSAISCRWRAISSSMLRTGFSSIAPARTIVGRKAKDKAWGSAALRARFTRMGQPCECFVFRWEDIHIQAKVGSHLYREFLGVDVFRA